MDEEEEQQTEVFETYRIEISSTIDADGRPGYHLRWGDEDNPNRDFLTALGLLDLARDSILRSAFGRDL